MQIGSMFGSWRVISDEVRRNSWHNPLMLCQCQCDRKTEKWVRVGNLLSGRSTCCKYCTKLTHGLTRGGLHHPVYDAYDGMIARCYHPDSTSADYYFGRGVKVDDRWLGPNGRANFIKDMLPTWKIGLTLHRVDNDGAYSKENCKWATWKEQNSSKESAWWAKTVCS